MSSGSCSSNNQMTFPTFQSRIFSISGKLARRKSQRSFLETTLKWDLCSSIRPKIGKSFSNDETELLKSQCLEDCRVKLVQLSIEDADQDILSLKKELKSTFESAELSLSLSDYMKLSKVSHSNESSILSSQMKKHHNKLLHYCMDHFNHIPPGLSSLSSVYSKPEKPIKHHVTVQKHSKQRNRLRRKKRSLKRKDNLSMQINSIKNSGLVVNFTDIEVPDSALLYLSKGSTFVPAVDASKHDLVFDTQEFLRKLSWKSYFNCSEYLNSTDKNDDTSEMVCSKLKLSSNRWPSFNNKLLDNVCSKITNFVDSLKLTEMSKFSNLSYLEKQGLFWCMRMKNSGIIHFSKADKGGAIVLMDTEVVHSCILSDLCNELNYQKLFSDPRVNIGNNLNTLCLDNISSKGLTVKEHFLITGHTELGKSHNPVFRAGKPNPFPLFKLHSLTSEELSAKTIPPHRLVTSMKYGPTKRSSLFVDSILTPVSIKYCGKEYIKDTPDFLVKLADPNVDLSNPQLVQLFTLDVKALYPSIKPEYLPFAIQAALDGVTDLSEPRKKAILDLVVFNISNAVTHYKGDWFKAILGIPTGGSDSVALANIYMKWVMLTFFSKNPGYKKYFVCQFRFIDDLFGGWLASERKFDIFVINFNDFGAKYGIVFDKKAIGDTVHFLDVLVSNATGTLVTDIYVKPTDTRRYLHRNSFHPQHTFIGIPFSQMRRAMLICSTPYLQQSAINQMVESFLKCGYNNDILEKAKAKALVLDREVLLQNSANLVDNSKEPVCFVLTHSKDVLAVKYFVRSLTDDIELLTGSNNIIFSLKRNLNTGSLLFDKYGFAQNSPILQSQKCGVTNCGSCRLKFPDNKPINLLPNFTIFPSKTANCKSENITYAAICKLCDDFYFGKSTNEEHVRMNGHRDKFTFDKFHKSALSMHVYVDHLDFIGSSQEEGLSNFNIVILNSTNAIDLRRKESYYIWSTEADLRHLNRYKVL